MNKHWSQLRWTAVLLLFTAVVAITLIDAGVFDPRPIGTEQWQRPLSPQPIAATSRRLLWLNQPLPDQPYSLRLTAAYQSGELDIGYGLALGRETQYLAVAVSPLGYVAIWQEITTQMPQNSQRLPSTSILPWQPWPHVHTNTETNELWIDVDPTGNSKISQFSVRINRELLWRGRLDTPAGQIGLLVESFGAAAVIDFQRLQLFHQ